MTIPGFTSESLQAVEQLLYAEGQENPLEGKCGQKKLREQNKQPRTPAQEQADRQRSLTQSGKPVGGGTNRSEAAKKAAETRARCKGKTNNPSPPTTV